jgi:hypothetical protein
VWNRSEFLHLLFEIQTIAPGFLSPLMLRGSLSRIVQPISIGADDSVAP